MRASDMSSNTCCRLFQPPVHIYSLVTLEPVTIPIIVGVPRASLIVVTLDVCGVSIPTSL